MKESLIKDLTKEIEKVAEIDKKINDLERDLVDSGIKINYFLYIKKNIYSNYHSPCAVKFLDEESLVPKKSDFVIKLEFGQPNYSDGYILCADLLVEESTWRGKMIDLPANIKVQLEKEIDSFLDKYIDNVKKSTQL